MKYTGLILIVIAVVIAIFIKKHFKQVKPASVCLVSGGVKTGKSSFAISICLREYKKRHIKWKIKKAIMGKRAPEEPLLYSNIPLDIPYVPITKELLRRKERFAYGSVVYLGEFSLIADSQLIKDKELNDDLLMFIKLFGHETKGGLMVTDSQAIADTHYSLRRCLSEYYYIHSVKNIFGLLFFSVSTYNYAEDKSTQFNNVEEDKRLVVRSKRVWKIFDCYCYSAFTDKLKVNKKIIKKVKSLKAKDIPSFKELKCDITEK